MAYHIHNPFVISFSKIYHIIGVIGFPFICLCLCICPCICLCICIFVRIWIADIISFQKIYGLRGTWGLTAVLQLIYELRKNCCGRVDGTGGRNIEGSTRGPRGPKKITWCKYLSKGKDREPRVACFESTPMSTPTYIYAKPIHCVQCYRSAFNKPYYCFTSVSLNSFISSSSLY